MRAEAEVIFPGDTNPLPCDYPQWCARAGSSWLGKANCEHLSLNSVTLCWYMKSAWWEHLYKRYWQILQIKDFFFLLRSQLLNTY